MNALRATGALVILGVALGGCGSGSSKAGSNTTRATATGATQPPATTTRRPTATIPPSREIAPGVVLASSGALTATMRASTHHPHVNRHWPIGFVVTRGGKRVKAEVRYQYLFAGQVVAHRSHYTFMGSFHDIFTWPSSAVGFPLTFRAVINAGGATLNLDYPVQVVG
ncbi:MAG TPA: hypothetical protein VFV03_02345 [Solirubrobacteraceae bacterium]|nr:hypothetical protein [Solirubrobacteraceae bacterium]